MSQFEIIDGVAVIPEGTQHIAMHAFKDCTELERVVLPEGIKTIGSGAFRGCSSLNSIELPEGLEKIDSRAFKRLFFSSQHPYSCKCDNFGVGTS